jgi:peptidoglycan/xylan/chitin deacetylase (PgdA/CDA1 family)
MNKTKFLAEVLHKSGATRGLDLWWGAHRLTVLAYHRIIDWRAPDFKDYEPVVSASPELFAQEMAFVAENFNVIDLETLQGYLFDDKPLPERPLLITFDDGYLDNYQNAYPILKKHAFPAVIFLVSSRMDNPVRLWWDECGYCFRFTKKTSATLPLIGEHSLASPEEKKAAREQLMRRLKQIPEEAKQEAMRALREALAVEPDKTQHFMSWGQVREIVANGISCQPHTVNHPIMTRISFEEQKRQLAESRARIIDETGQKADAFAIPNGTPADYSKDTLRALRETGYTTAFTLSPGPIPAEEARRYPLQIRRVYLGHKDTFEIFAVKVMGLEAILERTPYLQG